MAYVLTNNLFLRISIVIKSEPNDDVIIKTSSANDDDGNSNDHPPPAKLIKLESSDIEDDIDITTNTTSEPFVYEKIHPIVASASTIIAAAQPSKETTLQMVATSGTSASPTEPKYCHICDIKFTYLNTYLAHKQFYCKKTKPDISDASGTTTSPRVSPVANLGGRTATETSVL